MFEICATCRHRCELHKLLAGYEVGVEIGVLHAAYSKVLLSTWSGFLHLIDPWEISDYDPKKYEDWKHNFHAAMETLSAFAVPGTFSPPRTDPRMDWSLMRSERFRVWREHDSVELADKIGMVDFCYVDGNHLFNYVDKDIRMWWDHIKPGGILAGHDMFHMEWPDVTEAVVLFAKEVNRDVCIINGKDGCPCGEGGVPSWYLFR